MFKKSEIQVTVPHGFSQEEAVHRIRTGLESLKERHGHHVSTLEMVWTDNCLEGKATAMGQTVTGSLDVQPTQVIVVMRLPFYMAMMKDKIQSFVQRNGEKILQIA